MKKKFCIVLIIFTLISTFYSIKIYAFGPSSSVIYNGIDVSVWQGYIDFNAVKNDGIEIVYIRAGQGSSYRDPNFWQNYNNAKANGLKVGFYHYVTARSTEQAITQAQFFASIISGTEPDCKLAVDFESFGSLSYDEINAITMQFAQTVQQLTGKEVVIYSNGSTAKNILYSEVTKYPIWVAHYGVQEPMDNGKWDTWVGWQYTSTGSVAGISTNVDRDYYTDAILLGRNIPTPEPPNPVDPCANQTTYTVQYGDTLAKIALTNGTSVNHLAELNKISDPNIIYAGQQLLIDSKCKETEDADTGHVLYTIQIDDTLTEIAAKYKVTIKVIVDTNGISNPDKIYAGYAIRVPIQINKM